MQTIKASTKGIFSKHFLIAGTIKTNVDMLLRIGDEQEQTQQRFSQRE